MVIDPNTSLNTGNTNARSAALRSEPARSAPSSNSVPEAPASGDSVSLSSEAQSIGRLASAANNLADVDLARVDEIRSAIASGQYQIEPDAIADAILRQDFLA